jgi:hypothetical protein
LDDQFLKRSGELRRQFGARLVDVRDVGPRIHEPVTGWKKPNVNTNAAPNGDPRVENIYDLVAKAKTSIEYTFRP